MASSRLFWRLYPTYLGITLAALLAVTLHATHVFKQFHLTRVKHDLVSEAFLIRAEVSRLVETGNSGSLQELCRQLGEQANRRITVVLANGTVVSDSDENPATMDNHGDRPEIQAALAGAIGDDIRYSHTLGEEMAYVAVALPEPHAPRGAVRLAIPLTELHKELARIYLRLALGMLGITLLAAGLAMFVARRISQPLEQMQAGAARFGHGDLTHRLPASGVQEFNRLAQAMNEMAAELNHRIRSAVRQRNELEAILASMVEGVLAVDTQKCLLSMNRAAADLFEVDAAHSLGRSLEEILRSPHLQRLVSDVLTRQESVTDEFVLYRQQERFLHAQGTVLRDAENRLIGALVVLYDVTQIKRLENVRRDFVANVSHELKTPITSIKGYVETLLDGAMHDPQDAERFLRIVANQSDRLNSIIDDLLALSQVEQKAEKAEIPLEQAAIRPVLQAAIEVSTAKAAECGVAVTLQCDPGLRAHINAPLLEQAVSNLIDNACKHSPAGSTVWVEGERVREQVVIRVRDRGCGIEAHHLPRLFERFYRVDKSRSRKLGGTGLGLAIVKHISQAHHGQVKVTSAPNQGSTFQIWLPANLEAVSDESRTERTTHGEFTDERAST